MVSTCKVGMNWSLHRWTDVICAVVTASVVVVALLFINGEKLGLTKIISDGGADRDGIFSERDYRETWSETTSVKIDLDKLDQLGNNGGAYVLDGDVHIVTAGTYVLAGSLQNGQVIVEAKNDKVQLVLNNVTLTHDTLSPLVVTAADKVFVTLPGGSTNVITADNLASPEASATGLTAAIDAQADLAFNGQGKLVITAGNGHGIKSTDDLIITNGEYVIQAGRTALLGRDSVRIAAGSFQLDANEGIKANNLTKSTKGYVTIKGGEFNMKTAGDGIQAETNLQIDGGVFQIVTDGGVENAPVQTHEFGGPMGGEMKPSDANNRGDGQLDFAGARPPEPPRFHDENIDNLGNFDHFVQNNSSFAPTFNEAEELISAKCLKASGTITISGGNFDLNCRDDAIHADTNVFLSGGEMTIATGDDAVHAGKQVVMAAGKYTVSASYEGVEAEEIRINGGDIDIVSSDDGFNARKSDGRVFGPMEMSLDTSDLAVLEINGGKVHINAGGDGLDSNGDVIINDGEVIIDGPTNSGNGALDSGSEIGGQLLVNGGVVLALGASGMDETFSSRSGQNSLRVTLAQRFAAGEQLTITDENGSELFGYQIIKSGNSLVFSSPLLYRGQTYTVRVGDQVQMIAQDDVSVGESEGGFGFGGPGVMRGAGVPGKSTDEQNRADRLTTKRDDTSE